jgi:hypothetical protein
MIHPPTTSPTDIAIGRGGSSFLIHDCMGWEIRFNSILADLASISSHNEAQEPSIPLVQCKDKISITAWNEGRPRAYLDYQNHHWGQSLEYPARKRKVSQNLTDLCMLQWQEIWPLLGMARFVNGFL